MFRHQVLDTIKSWKGDRNTIFKSSQKATPQKIIRTESGNNENTGRTEYIID